MNKIVEYITHFIPSRAFLKIKYMQRMRKTIDLSNPRTFNEKIQWLKLNDHNPAYIQMVDKYEMKQWISNNIGENYVVPLLGIWNSFDEINFDCLPEQFVLKCTHDSGGLIICKDKTSLDKNYAKKKIERCLNTNYYWHGREWPYKFVKPRIIAEVYMENENQSDLIDYKVFCFNGKPEIVLVCQDRYKGTGLVEDFYSIEWKHLNIRRPGHPNATAAIDRPTCLHEMLELSSKLTSNLPFARVDFYVIGNSLYIGEFTLYPASGLTPFEPEEIDLKLGEKIDLRLAFKG